MHAPDTHVRLTFGSSEQVLNELVGALTQAHQESATVRP